MKWKPCGETKSMSKLVGPIVRETVVSFLSFSFRFIFSHYIEISWIYHFFWDILAMHRQHQKTLPWHACYITLRTLKKAMLWEGYLLDLVSEYLQRVNQELNYTIKWIHQQISSSVEEKTLNIHNHQWRYGFPQHNNKILRKRWWGKSVHQSYQTRFYFRIWGASVYAAYLNVRNKVDILKPDEIECVAGIIEVEELLHTATHPLIDVHLGRRKKTILVLFVCDITKLIEK